MTNSRFFTEAQRLKLFMNAEGKCQDCNTEISLGNFHADHITPFSLGGKTELSNGQALCSTCNLKKSSQMQIDCSNHLPPGFELRAWQEEAINRCYKSIIQQINKPTCDIQAFLLHAFPGSGKTLFSTLIAKLLLSQGFIERVIICVPSTFLKDQMEDDARQVGLFLNKKKLDDFKLDGVITTYAQIGKVNSDSQMMNNAEKLRLMCCEKKTLVISDECHHLGLEKNWGEGFQFAFSSSVARLMTSGTPFRSDNQRLPWVRYRQGKIDLSPPHAYSYGYGLSIWNKSYCALGDKVVRDVVIHPWDGEVEFTITVTENDTGLTTRTDYTHRLTDNIDELYPCTFDEDGQRLIDNRSLRKTIKSQRRIACIECGTPKHPYGTEYIREQLIAANDQLKECRRAHKWAGGLIICDDIKHADSVAKALKHWTGEDAVVVHSGTGQDNRAIKAFKENKTPSRAKWIIAVGMITEGVDIKHLRVAVYLTSIQASLTWIQIIGRILRTEKELEWDLQTAHFFQYDDGMELVADDDGNFSPESVNIKLYAETLLEERALSLRVKGENRDSRRNPTRRDGGSSRSTLVECHSATGINTQQIYDGERIDNNEIEPYRILGARLEIPPVKVASMIKKGGKDEWKRVLNDPEII